MSTESTGGWTELSLAEAFACVTDGDHQPPPQVESGVPLLVIGDIRGGDLDFEGSRFVSASYYDALPEHKKPRRNDILYTIVGTIGVAVLVDTDQRFCVQRHIAILKTRTSPDPKYLKYAMQSEAAKRQAVDAATGTAQMTVPLSGLRRVRLPIAPLAVQHRIVAEIETQFTRLDAAMSTLEGVKLKLKRARASVLKAAVEGRLVPTEAELARAEGRPYEPASELLARIVDEQKARWPKGKRYVAPTEPSVSAAPELPGGWVYCRIDTAGLVQLGRQRSPANHQGPNMRPYLRVANVFEDRIDLSDVMEMNFTAAEYETFRLHPGDILLNEGQSPHLVGRPAMWAGQREGMCFTNSLIRFKAEPGVLPRYAIIVFLAQLSARRYMKLVTITTNIAHLGAQRFAAVEFPLPPLAEQTRIVAEVERRLSVLDALAATVDRSLARCARLRQSVLKRAFEGKLVPQDPASRPQSVPLDRVSPQVSDAV